MNEHWKVIQVYPQEKLNTICQCSTNDFTIRKACKVALVYLGLTYGGSSETVLIAVVMA